jgi:hypothetical protein
MSEMQIRIWEWKLLGKSFEEIRQLISGDQDQQVSTASLWNCVKLTAAGQTWRPGSSGGRKPFLNADEEMALGSWATSSPEGRSMAELLEAATEIRYEGLMKMTPILHAMGCPTIADKILGELSVKSRTWGYGVIAQLNLKIMAPEILESIRSEYATSGLIMRWFTQMSNEISNSDACLIFNFDETMLHAQSKTKVIVTGDKKAFRRKTPAGPHITLCMCFSPLGSHPPPLIILPGVHTADKFDYYQSVGTVSVMNSPSGWMTTDLFHQWAILFCSWLAIYRLTLPPHLSTKTIILFIDSCRTHCSESALTLLADSNVKVITFPPHVTHVLQPIDVGCVKAFKAALVRNSRYFEKHIDEFIATQNESQRHRASLVLSTISSLNACDLRICSNAFRKAGLYPFSPQCPLASPYVVPSDVDQEMIQRCRRPELLHIGSSVMTSPEFIATLRERTTRPPVATQ